MSGPAKVEDLIRHLEFVSVSYADSNDASDLRPDGWPTDMRHGITTRLDPRHVIGVIRGRIYSDDEEKELHRRQDQCE